MNWSKKLYIFMLSAIIVMSGCFGSGTTDGQDGTEDADDGSGGGTTTTNPSGSQGNVLWYVSGTTYHQCTPTSTGANNSGYCVDDDETLADEWVMVQNYTTIHQAPNTGIKVISHAGSPELTHINSRIGTVCTNGAIAGWGFTSDNGDRYDNSYAITYDDGLLPFAGLECNHYLFGQNMYSANITVHWHVAYEVLGLTPGPH